MQTLTAIPSAATRSDEVPQGLKRLAATQGAIDICSASSRIILHRHQASDVAGLSPPHQSTRLKGHLGIQALFCRWELDAASVEGETTSQFGGKEVTPPSSGYSIFSNKSAPKCQCHETLLGAEAPGSRSTRMF